MTRCDRAVSQFDGAVSQCDRAVSQFERAVSFGRDERGFRGSIYVPLYF